MTLERYKALYRISEAAHQAPDLDALFRAIHQIISELLPARNFYVALYDQASDIVRFPYWVDEVDERPEPRKISEKRGLTGLVLQTGEALLLTPDTTAEIAARTDISHVGSDGIDWLGVPLKTSAGTIGVLTVQDYTGETRYGEQDKELLRFVSDQVAAAVERKQAEQELRDSEERFRRVFFEGPIIFFLLSYPEGRILELNAAAAQAFGRSREELLGQSIEELGLFPDAGQVQVFRAELEARGAVQNHEMRVRRRDGSEFTVLHSCSKVKLGGDDCVLCSMQDITDRKRAEHWQQHYAQVLAAITAEQPLGEVLAMLARFAEAQSPGMLCSIHRVSSDGRRLLHGAAPSLPPAFSAAIDGAEIGPHAGSCGAAAATGRVAIAEDVRTHPDWVPWRPLAAEHGLVACWSHPVQSSDGRTLGTFAQYRREPSVPGPEDLELIRQSAGLAAIAIERAQHQAEQRLAHVVFEQSQQALMVTDAHDRVLLVNGGFEALTAYGSQEVIGRTPDILQSPREEPGAERERRLELMREGRWSGESWWRRKSGESLPVALSLALVRDAAGEPSHVISIASDVSEQKLQAARIEQLAFYDSLTGLPNRALFLNRLEQILTAARRHGNKGAILFLDLDRFKEINDSQGHAVGDLALAEVSRRLLKAARREETLARLGGDEFVLIAEGADVESAILVATRLQQALSTPLEVGGNAHVVGASIGIAFYPEDGDRSEDLIRRTDIAMYQAKAEGGGYRLYRSEMGTELEKRIALAKHLKRALEGRGLQLFYQPQIQLSSRQLVGAEALIRWYHDELGWISPGEFVPIAEERGMMVALGDWVLRQACKQVRAWTDEGLPLPGWIAINMSASQMEDPNIVSHLLGIVHEAGLQPQAFELELTESTMMSDPERAVLVLEQLAAAGFHLSIDDFGTG